jgi:hypothetical protein
MKITILPIFALVIMVLWTTTNLAAQDRINFRRGASSASVSGRIGATQGFGSGHYRYYVVRARGGQTITATVSSGNGKVYFAQNDRKTYRIRTDRLQDYEINIFNSGEKSTKYSLTVSIR